MAQALLPLPGVEATLLAAAVWQGRGNTSLLSHDPWKAVTWGWATLM